jgi:hypothetical protein
MKTLLSTGDADLIIYIIIIPLMKAIGKYLIEKESLGKGQFGHVFRCRLKDDASQQLAVKII